MARSATEGFLDGREHRGTIGPVWDEGVRVPAACSFAYHLATKLAKNTPHIKFEIDPRIAAGQIADAPHGAVLAYMSKRHGLIQGEHGRAGDALRRQCCQRRVARRESAQPPLDNGAQRLAVLASRFRALEPVIVGQLRPPERPHELRPPRLFPPLGIYAGDLCFQRPGLPHRDAVLL